MWFSPFKLELEKKYAYKLTFVETFWYNFFKKYFFICIYINFNL